MGSRSHGRTRRTAGLGILAALVLILGAACSGDAETARVAVEDVGEPAEATDMTGESETPPTIDDDADDEVVAQGPTAEVGAALERTIAGPLRFELAFDLDETARKLARAEDPMIEQILDGSGLRGAFGEDSVELVFSFVGADIFELRQVDTAHTYMRMDMPGLGDIIGEPIPVDDLMSGLTGYPESMQTAMETMFGGQWVGFIGDPEALEEKYSDTPALDEEALRADMKRAFGATPTEFVSRFLILGGGTADSDGVQTYAVQIRLRELFVATFDFNDAMFRQLFGAPFIPDAEVDRLLDEIPVTVGNAELVVRDGVIERLSVDAFGAMRELGIPDTPDGSLQLVLTFSHHGTQPDIAAPQSAFDLELESLVDDLRSLPAPAPPGPGPTDEGGTAQGAIGPAGDDVPDVLKHLVTAQASLVYETGAFSNDPAELLRIAGLDVPPGTPLGACVTAGGDGFVVAMLVNGTPLYVPSDTLAGTTDPSTLRCLPAIGPVGGSHG